MASAALTASSGPWPSGTPARPTVPGATMALVPMVAVRAFGTISVMYAGRVVVVPSGAVKGVGTVFVTGVGTATVSRILLWAVFSGTRAARVVAVRSEGWPALEPIRPVALV